MTQAIDLANKSDSNIIIFLVVIAIIIISLIPVMNTVARIKREERKQANEKEERERKQTYEREDKFIQVIERNTEVNSALKAVIEKDQKSCGECKQEQMGLFRKLFDNQELANVKLAEITTIIKREV